MTTVPRGGRQVAATAAAIVLAFLAAGCADIPTRISSDVSFPSPSFTRPAIVDPVVTPSAKLTAPMAPKDWSTGVFAFSVGRVVAVVQFPCPSSNPYAGALESVRQQTSGTRLHLLAVTVRNSGSSTFDLAQFHLVTTSGQVVPLTTVAGLIGQWTSGDAGINQVSYSAAVDLQRALPALVPPGATVTSLIATDHSVFNVTGVVYAGRSTVVLAKVWTLRRGTAAQQILWARAQQLLAQIPGIATAQNEGR